MKNNPERVQRTFYKCRNCGPCAFSEPRLLIQKWVGSRFVNSYHICVSCARNKGNVHGNV